MKTSCFSLYKGDGRISIARYAPRNTPAGYRIYNKLAPGSWFNSVSEAKYNELFRNEILAPLDPRRTWDELHAMTGGYEPVLLCWEKPGEFCHRHLVASWFEQELGVTVSEYDPKATPQQALF
ncbi:hypothetical protein LB105_004576 [Salmonella enterica]|uniref:DUF488 domain-containing protein n=6 Tax=Salmonella enterica TaxID=28901 RepID=A0A3V7B6S0_SALER|nr:hypothetical protein [Salmonella enterica]EAA2595842.1 hypothetical protein [Salmonella enterica subsp. enterica serovar Poona]EAA6844257.1 hypothetical protein [Salmonella enterica subsp. enterica serovar Pensacola]EBK1959546.1 DUF488 domain-containing protein [Salmonella enterica subsp. enterica serovar Newport]EBR7996461.1 hypothetical protein [Salmonella enterica subsp. enterica serovar Panama]EBW8395206.1 hypothetical protein [Salmonella enterica subsp. enterica serovar Florida]ECX600